MSFNFPITIRDLSEERIKQREAQGLNPLPLMVYTEPGQVLVPAAYKRMAKKIYHFKYRSDDIVVTTFPKSGTLWAMELVWAMTHLDQLDVTQKVNINDRVFLIDDVGNEFNTNSRILKKIMRSQDMCELKLVY